MRKTRERLTGALTAAQKNMFEALGGVAWLRAQLDAAIAAKQCTQIEPTDTGWSEWVCPIQRGYLMQCCGCDLVHEVEFRVMYYPDEVSDFCRPVADKGYMAQFRMRRPDGEMS